MLIQQKTKIHLANATNRPQVDEELHNVQPHNVQHQIKLATILLICFIAEHNLPFMIADHLIDLCKTIFPDPAIAQGLQMKRTKCTEITNHLGTCITNDLAEKLKHNSFSIIVDESTSYCNKESRSYCKVF